MIEKKKAPTCLIMRIQTKKLHTLKTIALKRNETLTSMINDLLDAFIMDENKK